MQIKIKTNNIAPTDSLSLYVKEKILSVEKFLEALHENGEFVAEVEIGKTTKHHHSGDVFRAEVNIRGKGKFFRAVSEKDDLYAAIDDVRNEIVREINSYKGKERALFRRGAGMIKNLLRFGRTN